MATAFRLQGSYTATPCSCGGCSGDASLSAAINECVQLVKETYTTIQLTADATTPVAFGDCTAANVVVMRTVGGKVKARFTSADGSQQAIPVDAFFAVISGAVPFTAIDITRVSGQETTVRVFLGQQAA